jgi:hypothetical protein
VPSFPNTYLWWIFLSAMTRRRAATLVSIGCRGREDLALRHMGLCGRCILSPRVGLPADGPGWSCEQWWSVRQRWLPPTTRFRGGKSHRSARWAPLKTLDLGLPNGWWRRLAPCALQRASFWSRYQLEWLGLLFFLYLTLYLLQLPLFYKIKRSLKWIHLDMF